MTKEIHIIDILGVGRENVKTTEELMKALNIHHKRELTELIYQERKEGAVIISSSQGGYYLPSHKIDQEKEELETFIRSMNSRKKKIDQSTESARKRLQAIEKECDQD